MRPLDTSAEAHEVQLAAWRRMGPEARLLLALEMSETARELSRCGIRARHPEYGADEVEMALRRLVLGKDLFHQAYPQGPDLAP